MQVTGKANVRNRFDIHCRDIVTGEEQKYQAHNIVLDSMFTRLVNFQTFFGYIHFGTGTGMLSPAGTSLFTSAGYKSATTVEQVRVLPTSHWMRQVVLNPEEYVGHELTEVGVAYSTSSTGLVTHAFIEDSEGNPISIVKTDTMVVTIYATIFFELGELTSMYGGQWRWVMPLERNELLSYLMGASYPAQTFRVSSVIDFRTDGTAPGSHGYSPNILVADWTKDVANKRVTTPVRRLGIDVGNGAIRGFGLGSGNDRGTFRGQFPIPGIFSGHLIEGEAVGVGDGETTGFDLAWDDAENLTVYINGVAVDPEDYSLVARRNVFLGKIPVIIEGQEYPVEILTDGVRGDGLSTAYRAGIDVGEAAPEVGTFRASTRPGSYASRVTLLGTDNADYSEAVEIATLTPSAGQWSSQSFTPVSHRYYRLHGGNINGATNEVQLLAVAHNITFNTAPDVGAVITADYTVPYIPKDENHVLDLQCAIQWGEPV